jgi:hypothetical protein
MLRAEKDALRRARRAQVRGTPASSPNVQGLTFKLALFLAWRQLVKMFTGG